MLRTLNLIVAVVAVVIGWMAWQYPKSPHTTQPGPADIPTVISPNNNPVRTEAPSVPSTERTLEFYQLQGGDCLSGANLPLDSSDTWPNLLLTVPCRQAHTAEIFYVNDSFWNDINPFPGYNAIAHAADVACKKEFKSYVGISDLDSIYVWDAIAPYTAANWQEGGQSLVCVGWYLTSKHPAGAIIYGSIRGADE